MYHIPNDARALRSAELLSDGLVRLMKKKLLPDITVKDLVAVSGVSRATYYRLFDNLTDILSWKLDFIISSSMEEAVSAASVDFRHIFLEFIRHRDRHRDLINGLIRSGRSDLIYTAHRNHMDDILRYLPIDQELSDVQKEYLAEYLAVSVPIAFRVSEKYPESEPELYYHDIITSLSALGHFLNP